MMKRKILVSGANGFIATHILLRGLELFPSNRWVATSASAEKAKHKPWYDKVEFIPLDYHKSVSDFPLTFSEHDILIHAAWGFLPFYKKAEHVTVELPAQKNSYKHVLKTDFVTFPFWVHVMNTGCRKVVWTK